MAYHFDGEKVYVKSARNQEEYEVQRETIMVPLELVTCTCLGFVNHGHCYHSDGVEDGTIEGEKYPWHIRIGLAKYKDSIRAIQSNADYIEHVVKAGGELKQALVEENLLRGG